MRRLFLLCMMAVAFPLSAGPVKIWGEVSVETGTEAELFFVKLSPDGERVSQKIGMDGGSYEVAVEDETPFFATLYGVLTGGEGSKRQATLPLYVDAGREEFRLDIAFLEKSAPIVKTDDKGTSALVAYNTFLYTHHVSGPLAKEEIKPFLDKFSAVADSICRESSCDEIVRDYLRIWAYIQERGSIDMLRRIFRNDPECGAVLREVAESLPDEKIFLDNETAALFYDTPHLVLQSLRTGKTPEEKLAALEQGYGCVAVVEKVEELIFDQYIQRYDYNKDTAGGYERLQKMTEGRKGREEYLEKFLLRTRSAVGAEAPDAAFLDKEGKEFHFSDFKGKYLYVDFWASWCVPCVREIPLLQELEKGLQNDQVLFVAISLDEDREAWGKKREELCMEGYQFVVQDKGLADMLNIRGIPFYIILDKEGKMKVYDAPRPSSGEVLKELLESLK